MYDLVIFCDFPPTQWDDDTPNWYQENKGIRCTSVLINGPSIHTTWNLFLMQWKRVKATSENTKQRGEMKSLSLFEESYKKYLQGKWIKWAFWDSNVASQSQTPPHPLRHFSQGSNVSLLYSNMNYIAPSCSERDLPNSREVVSELWAKWSYHLVSTAVTTFSSVISILTVPHTPKVVQTDI